MIPGKLDEHMWCIPIFRVVRWVLLQCSTTSCARMWPADTASHKHCSGEGKATAARSIPLRRQINECGGMQGEMTLTQSWPLIGLQGLWWAVCPLYTHTHTHTHIYHLVRSLLGTFSVSFQFSSESCWRLVLKPLWKSVNVLGSVHKTSQCDSYTLGIRQWRRNTCTWTGEHRLYTTASRCVCDVNEMHTESKHHTHDSYVFCFASLFIIIFLL